jgi:SH3-like domain-containing protein
MLRRGTLILALAACLLFVPNAVLSCKAWAAEEEGKSAQLPVPRFVTLGVDEVNLRTGPGLRYPIRLVVRKDGLPVEIVREFDVWRQVRDADGDEGWVHKSMLSGRRAVIIKGSIRTLLKSPGEGRPVAKLEPGVIAGLKACRKDWCQLSVAGYSGWMKRDEVWGVYPDEKVGG